MSFKYIGPVLFLYVIAMSILVNVIYYRIRKHNEDHYIDDRSIWNNIKKIKRESKNDALIKELKWVL